MQSHSKICLFVHYNRRSEISDYVLIFLKSLSTLHYRILLLSNSEISEHSRTRVEKEIPNCRFFLRENKGADFGAWSWAFANNLIPKDTDYLLLANDSVIGPFFNLAYHFESMYKDDQSDFWGLTDNFQGAWHIQSYFLLLNRQVLQSHAFQKVFSQNFNNKTKLEIIKDGEVRLSQELIAAGFKGRALFPYEDLDSEKDSVFSQNSTHFYWDTLITKFKYPFLKRDLLLQNPENIRNLNSVFHVVRKVSDFNTELIKSVIVNSLEPTSPVTVPDKKISILCHLYYPHSIYYFLSKLSILKSFKADFYFNLSDGLMYDEDFIDVLTRSFSGSVILHTPNKGRDIGGKFALIDAMLKSENKTDYTLIIHDKLSPHTPTGKTWRDKLFKVIEPERIEIVLSEFEANKKTGIIGTKDFVKTEFNPDKKEFDCTSNDILLQKLKDYKLHPKDFNFIAGTIFWIRSSVLESFFTEHKPLAIRKDFETGNALDFTKGTLIHAWERLFTMISTSQGYKIKGI
ncbi:rhamnan synthesis F family protein [Lacibacter sp. H407]|uniref:rhamnan synthesis F family protein n=1 Tax=Lacibacter sp. H407 TaxID=3133423 RepID=UPI0030BB9E0E